MDSTETKTFIEEIIQAHGGRGFRTQTFYCDKHKLLRRLDYTAEVVGHWAHAAHLCNEYRDFSGLKIPTHRRVRPLLFNRILHGPTLVALEIHDVQLKKHLEGA